jgi:hypothetical protein
MRARSLRVFLLLLSASVCLRLNAQTTQGSFQTQQTQGSAAAAAANAEAGNPESGPSSEITSEARKLHLRLGTVWVGAAYSHFSGPYFYPYGPYGFYPGNWVTASFWYPVWGPYPFFGPGYFAYNVGRGELRLAAEPKGAEVYIDGGYAGTADRLKDMWLGPGAYDLAVSASGYEAFHQRVYVLSGKTLKITAKLGTAGEKEKL